MPTPFEPPAYDFDVFNVDASEYWIEHIGDNSPNSDEFSTKYAHATLYGYLPDTSPATFYAFSNRMLGFSTVTGTDLSRTLPQQHPKHPQLYANKVSSAQGVQYRDRVEGISVDDESVQTLKKYAKYGRLLVAVDFAPLRYPVYPDNSLAIIQDDVVCEWLRYVDYDLTPQVYDVSIQTGQFFFVEGPTGNPKDKSFPGELNLLEVKTTFALNWRQVPEEFVLDTSYNFAYPTKIVRAAGAVNSAEFGGYPAGTLLLLEPEINRYLAPTLRVNDSRDPIYYCDITLPLIHFDPPNSSGDPAVSGYRGHNLKPWWANISLVGNTHSNTTMDSLSSTAGLVAGMLVSGSGIPAGTTIVSVDSGTAITLSAAATTSLTGATFLFSSTSLVYYLVTSAKGNPDGIRIFKSYDFSKIFTHWSVP